MSASSFDAAIQFVLRWEGGYVDNPADHGGATNRGITQRVYDAARAAQGMPVQDVRQIGDAEVMAIYRDGYWQPPRCDLLTPHLDLVQFDTAVNMGVKRAVAFLQGCVGCAPDGSFGDHTVQAVQQSSPAAVVASYCATREQFYRTLAAQKPDQAVFLQGWLNRLDALRAAAAVPGFPVTRGGVDFGDSDHIAKVPDIGEDPSVDRIFRQNSAQQSVE
jgi:lysozyme family protein